jgi:5-methylcytosine-specific restriction enzyme subunit McrC
MTTSHTLYEWTPSDPIELTVLQRDAIAQLAKGMSISPVQGTRSCFRLTPDSNVGAIVVGDLSIAILPKPKVTLEHVLFMLSYSVRLPPWDGARFAFAEDSLVEAVVPAFVGEVSRAIRRGLLQGYKVEEDALPTVRGRIRFDDQIRYRFGRFPPAEVRFDEFTEDIDANRLIKAAATMLLRMRLRAAESRRALRRIDSVMEDVSLIEYDRARLPEIEWTRLNEHYRYAVSLAQLVLRHCAFELPMDESGRRVHASSFLVDMNRVFEDFVRTAVREKLGLPEKAFPSGGKHPRLTLDDRGAGPGRIKLEPDLSWWEGPDCMFVGDIKYKRTERDGENSDLYQLLAYTVAANLACGLLVYAAGENAPATHVVRHLVRTLEVVTLDLAGTPDQLLDGMATVARRIAHQRTRNKRALARAA